LFSIKLLSDALPIKPPGSRNRSAFDPAKMQEYVNGTFANNGFLLASNVELNDRYYYPSSDSGSVSRHPKMVIQYTLDLSPSPSPTGEGSPPPLRRETSPNGNSTRAKADGGDLSVTAACRPSKRLWVERPD
jgi:hypothetical protein